MICAIYSFVTLVRFGHIHSSRAQLSADLVKMVTNGGAISHKLDCTRICAERYQVRRNRYTATCPKFKDRNITAYPDTSTYTAYSQQFDPKCKKPQQRGSTRGEGWPKCDIDRCKTHRHTGRYRMWWRGNAI